MKMLKVGVLVAAMSLLAGCGNLSTVTAQGTTKDPVWPDPSSATLKGGTWPQWKASHELVAGMTKEQLLNKLGHPHFSEGLVNVREWDYLFNYLRNGQKKVCQLKILFDNNYKARTFLWKPADCNDVYQLSADLLFSFDSATLSDRGFEALDEVVNNLKANHAKKIVVRGYADRIGAADYNLDLSSRRAEAVKAYLVQKGIGADMISTEGKGQAEPLVSCPGLEGEQLKACLAPNRRVEIETL